MPAKLRNISEHGMLLRLPRPPRPGTFIEADLGGGVTVAARVIWAADGMCGVQSRERFEMGAFGAMDRVPALKAAPQQFGRAKGHVPTAARLPMDQRSRQMASLFQYLTFVVIAVTAATGLGWEVYQILNAPMDRLQSALGHRQP